MIFHVFERYISLRMLMDIYHIDIFDNLVCLLYLFEGISWLHLSHFWNRVFLCRQLS